MAVRWTSMKLAATGPSGRPLPFAGKVYEVDGTVSPATWITVVVTVVLVSVGLFIPPVLLLSIPILLGRAAVAVFRMASDARVLLDPFECPECHGENPAGERRGELPLDLPCARCGAKLSVGQMPRLYVP